MRKVAIIVGILAGCVLAFVLCGGAELAGKVNAAMNANAAPVVAAE